MSTRFVYSRRLREITHSLTYIDATSAKIFEVPRGTRFIAWIINVKTAVAGGTTTLDVGTNTDGDYFLDGVDVSSKGLVSLTTGVLYPGHEVTVPTEVYANLGASNTAGEVDVTLIFSYAKDTPL